MMDEKITIRESDAYGIHMWNVLRGRKIVGRFPNPEAAEEYVARRWYKVPVSDRVKSLEWGPDHSHEEQLRLREAEISIIPRDKRAANARKLDCLVAEIEATEKNS